MRIGTGIGVNKVISSGIPVQSEFTTWYSAVVSNGGSLTTAQQSYYNNTIYYLKAANQWDNLDALQVYCGSAFNVVSVDLKKPTRIAVNTGCSFTANKGVLGVLNSNSAFLNTNFNPGDGGTYNYVQNSATIGYYKVDNIRNVGSHYSPCAATAAIAIPTIALQDNLYTTVSSFYINASAWTAGTSSYALPVVNGWNVIQRTGASSSSRYFNGVKLSSSVVSSGSIANCKIALLNDYGNNALIGSYGSAETVGCFFAGNGTLDANIMQGILNKYLIQPLGSTYDLLKRVIFEGDSYSGYGAGTTTSVSSAYPKQTMSLLGTGWCCSPVSMGGERVDQMITQYPTDISPYKSTYLTKDIVILEGGINDIGALHTAATVYSDIVTWCNLAKADGFSRIIVGVPANYAGANQTFFNTNRDSLRALMLADFTVNLGGNLWGPSTGITYADIYIDVYADVNYQDYTDVTYYQVDQVHLTTTGYNGYGVYVSNAINLL